ncbi:unnamed protein product [Aspergillus oryzae RIB40]|uniref:DNA, SC113 n=1 Tax=Aspergillus oryzae (strain ATCC 42149 / RIB 40) TaxID=510516 RepID=Q2U5Z2_ASPOR|nr:unnamed protein product [Aspergillus oryzae RIB40]BAE63023.1 unnamed protein product [Aspergillus oryzae RIB40]
MSYQNMTMLYWGTGTVIVISLALLVRLRDKRHPSTSCQADDNVVIITGGCSGLGREMANIYRKNGAKVAVLDIHLGDSHSILGETVRYYKCDVANEEQVEQVVNRIEVETFSKTINTNLMGPVHTIRTILPQMIASKRNASIVNVSSVVAHVYPGGLSDYTASKAALSALHHCLDAEARYYGYDERIKFFLVEVGQMETPLFKWVKTPYELLTPVLSPKYVAEKVITAVESGCGRLIRLPRYASWACVYDALPTVMQQYARQLGGLDRAMAT